MRGEGVGRERERGMARRAVGGGRGNDNDWWAEAEGEWEERKTDGRRRPDRFVQSHSAQELKAK